MASVTSMGHFPFCFTEIAEDGEPVEVWDGSTYFATTRWDGALIKTPSKSSSSQVSVVGIGTECPVGFTFDRMMQLYWRCKWDKLTFTTDFQAQNGRKTVILSSSSPKINDLHPADPSFLVCGPGLGFGAGEGHGVSISFGSDENGNYYPFCSSGYGIFPYWVVEVGVSIGLRSTWGGGSSYVVTESNGEKKYYPKMDISIGSRAWDRGFDCAQGATGTYGSSGVSASLNWNGSYIAELKARDWGYPEWAIEGLGGVPPAVDTTINFTLRDSEGIPFIDNLSMRGIKYHGDPPADIEAGPTSASGTYIDATLPNKYDYATP